MTLPPTPPDPPDDEAVLAERPSGRAGRHRRAHRFTWPRFAERILGGWGPTLRMAAVLVTIIAVGVVCVLAAWGAIGVAAVILLCAMVHSLVSHLPRPLRI